MYIRNKYTGTFAFNEEPSVMFTINSLNFTIV